MVSGLHHIGIAVTNMENSLNFYRELLGFELDFREKSEENLELAFLYHPRKTDVQLELVKGEEVAAREGRVNHIAFNVENLDVVLAHLKESGVELITEEPMIVLGGRKKVAFFRGPDGEKLEIIEEIG